jgi:hypothetical protein
VDPLTERPRRPAQALEVFQEDYKAKGLKGDDKTSQRDFAMAKLSKVQHPDVVDALGKVSRSSDEILRMLAIVYLGEQRALPHDASRHVLAAMRRGKKDEVLLITGLQSLGSLKYLGAGEELAELLGHRSYVVRKAAIGAIGQVGDVRLLGELLEILGIKTETESGKPDEKQSSGEPETTEEGYSWDGVDVTYDTGAPDDSDQKMAEKIGKEKLAANKAAAEANAGRSGGSSGGSAGPVGGGGGRGAQSRSNQELQQPVLVALHRLTGEKFDHPRTIRTWLREHAQDLVARCKALDEAEKAQKDGP